AVVCVRDRISVGRGRADREERDKHRENGAIRNRDIGHATSYRNELNPLSVLISDFRPLTSEKCSHTLYRRIPSPVLQLFSVSAFQHFRSLCCNKSRLPRSECRVRP